MSSPSQSPSASRTFERVLLLVIAACLVVMTVDRLLPEAHAYDGAVQRVFIVGGDSRSSVPVHVSGLVPTRGEQALAVRIVGTDYTPGGAGTMGNVGNVGPDWNGSDYGTQQRTRTP